MNVTSAYPHLLVAARTNRGNVYTIYISLENFPESVPAAYVTKRLLDHEKKEIACCGQMHFLGYENNMSKICHYGSQAWTPAVSLYKVYIKCRLWLEMYEQHLATGMPIDYYLTHQK